MHFAPRGLRHRNARIPLCPVWHTGLAIALALLAPLFVAACGGGGGGGGSKLIPLSTDTFRAYAVGDSWEFSGKGTLTNAAGSSPVTANTSNFITSLQKPGPESQKTRPDGFEVAAVAFSEVSTAGSVPQTINGEEWLWRGSDLSVWAMGNSGHGWIFDGTDYGFFLSYPGTLTVGDVWVSGVVRYEDGWLLETTRRVTAIEPVTTPAGRFEAYRVETTSTWREAIFNPTLGPLLSGARQDIQSVDWVVPGLTTLVKTEFTRTRLDEFGVLDYSLSMTAVLTSTSIPF